MKLLQRDFRSPHQFDYLAFNDPDMVSRYVFEEDKVVDEVTRTSYPKAGGVFHLPVPDLTLQAVRVAFRFKGNENIWNTEREIFRIGSTDGFTLKFTVSQSGRTPTAHWDIDKHYVFKVFTGQSSFTASVAEYTMSNVFEFSDTQFSFVRTPHSGGRTSGIGNRGDIPRFSSAPISTGSAVAVPDEDHSLTNEFSHEDIEIVCIEVRNRKAYTAHSAYSTYKPRPYYGVMCSDRNENLLCNYMAVGSIFTDTLSNNPVAFEGSVSNGFITLGAAAVLKPAASEVGWSVRLVVATTTQGNLFTVKRNDSTLTYSLEGGVLRVNGSELGRIRRNGLCNLWIIGTFDTVSIYVDGYLVGSEYLPLTYPATNVEVTLVEGLRLAGVQMFDCQMASSQQLLNYSVSDYVNRVVPVAIYDNEDASVDISACRNIGLSSGKLVFFATTGQNTKFRLPSSRRAPVVGFSAKLRLFPQPSTGYRSGTCLLSFKLNGKQVSCHLKFLNSTDTSLRFVYDGEVREINYNDLYSSLASGISDQTMDVQTYNGCIIMSFAGRTFTLEIPKSESYVWDEVTFGWVNSGSASASVSVLECDSIYLYCGDKQAARKVPWFDNGEVYAKYKPQPNLVLAYGADNTEFVSGSTGDFPVQISEWRQAAILDAQSVGSIPCAVPALNQFTLAATFTFPEEGFDKSITLGDVVIRMAESKIIVEVKDSAVEYEVVDVLPHSVVATYTGSKLKLTVDAVQVGEDDLTGTLQAASNLTVSGEGSFIFVSDLRLYSDVRDAPIVTPFRVPKVGSQVYLVSLAATMVSAKPRVIDNSVVPKITAKAAGYILSSQPFEATELAETTANAEATMLVQEAYTLGQTSIMTGSMETFGLIQEPAPEQYLGAIQTGSLEVFVLVKEHIE